MSQANRMGLRNMTTARGSRLSRWFTKEYLASGSDFDYEEEMKTKSSPDKVRIISQPEVVFHSLLLPCPICTLSTPTNWMKCGKTWRMKELPGTLRLKISFLLMELLRQTNIIITPTSTLNKLDFFTPYSKDCSDLMLHTKWNSIDKYSYSSHVTYTGVFSILFEGKGYWCHLSIA